MANKYSPNKRKKDGKMAKQAQNNHHVNSCHLDEENFYMKEIDNLKNELNTLKKVENELIGDQGESYPDILNLNDSKNGDAASLV